MKLFAIKGQPAHVSVSSAMSRRELPLDIQKIIRDYLVGPLA